VNAECNNCAFYIELLELKKYTFGDGAELNYYVWQFGEHGGADGWGSALQAGMSRVRSGFFIYIILSAILWPWGSNNSLTEVPGISPGVKAAGA